MRKNKSFDEYSMEMANVRNTLSEMKEHVTKALELARNVSLIDCKEYTRFTLEFTKKNLESVIKDICYIYSCNVNSFCASKKKNADRLSEFLIKEFTKQNEAAS